MIILIRLRPTVMPESVQKWTVLDGRVYGLSVSNKTFQGLQERINITVPLQSINGTLKPCCAFYDFSNSDFSMDGLATHWSEGDVQVICSCDHLTYFAILMVASESQVKGHEQSLTYITLIGCSISLLFLICTVLLFLIQRQKQKFDVSRLVHVNLAAALILLNGHFLPSSWVASLAAPAGCVYIALVLHYSLLATLAWMAVEGFHLYMLMVRVFNIYIRRYLLKLALFAWVLASGPVLVILSVLLTCFVVLWTYSSLEAQGDAHPPSPRTQHLNRTGTQQPAGSPPLPPGARVEEWQKVKEVSRWPVPEQQVTFVNESTSAGKSTFTIQNFKESYSVGEELLVTIFAKDYIGRPKRYGGDFFQAKVHSPSLKASVFGEVVDHHNGTYSVRFLLPWAGQASVAVLLVQSSEIILALEQHWSTDTNQVIFRGFFVSETSTNGKQVEETALCTIKWPGVLLPGTGDMAPKNCCCEYRDARTGLTWHCYRPKTLPCDALIYHNVTGYPDHFTPLEKKLAQGTQYLWLNGDQRQIKITSTNATVGRERNACRGRLPTPVPAGFYVKDVWTSFVCATRHFQGPDAAACLRNRHIYIIGDSTLRQWFLYLIQIIPTLELHSLFNAGPNLATDAQNNIDLHHRAHGLPYHIVPKVKMVALQYIENLIDEMDGGPHTVLVFTMSAHFAGIPLTYFVHRVSLVRRAVASLLRRSPQTKVIIKSPNTSNGVRYFSLWIFYMHHRVLREAFRDMDVYFLDVWQMTSCHYNTYDMHPQQVIVRNEVDILLSYICPK